MRLFTWARYNSCGYECSSRGDKRFSAFFARMPDGRSIEEHYQCDVKGYDPGGTNWCLGKGKPGLQLGVDLWLAYLGLWCVWAETHQPLLDDLEKLAVNGVLTDRFAAGSTNQAHALAEILSERGR